MDTLLLKIPEAAGYLGLSRAKVYELIGAGALPAVKIGGSRRIRVSDLRDFVNGLDSSVGAHPSLDAGRPRVDGPLS